MINITPQQLRKAADIQEQIQSLQSELNEILGGEVSTAAQTTEEPKKRKFTAATRAKMKAAQQARWAAKRGEAGTEATPAELEKPKKKPVSEARLKGLAKAREARWAKVRAAKSTQAEPAKASDKSAQEKPKQKRKMTAAWRKALERAWAAKRAKTKAAKKAKS